MRLAKVPSSAVHGHARRGGGAPAARRGSATAGAAVKTAPITDLAFENAGLAELRRRWRMVHRARGRAAPASAGWSAWSAVIRRTCAQATTTSLPRPACGRRSRSREARPWRDRALGLRLSPELNRSAGAAGQRCRPTAKPGSRPATASARATNAPCWRASPRAPSPAASPSRSPHVRQPAGCPRSAGRWLAPGPVDQRRVPTLAAAPTQARELAARRRRSAAPRVTADARDPNVVRCGQRIDASSPAAARAEALARPVLCVYST
ncbi:MAG: hypothetical protein MZW92_36705 [Comamonadaceae bacterium]|nr:hypothetical protein [Comamonadaceae bacterium]